jgi:hypothetical protein
VAEALQNTGTTTPREAVMHLSAVGQGISVNYW